MRNRARFVALGLLATLGSEGVAVAADTFKADPVHSSVVYRVKHMGTSHHWGRFNEMSGEFTLDAVDPSKDRFDFQIKTASIDSGNPKRDQHLKSPDFFNAVQFPTISFKSKAVAKSGAALDVSGDLTLHGVTKPVTLKINLTGTGKDMAGKPIAGIDTNFLIKQTDFGITKMTGAAIGDEVLIVVAIEGQKQ